MKHVIETLKEEIRKSLPSAVGDELQSVLSQAKSDREKVENLEVANKAIKEKEERLEKKERDVSTREANADSRAKALDDRAAKISELEALKIRTEIKERILDARLDDMKEIVLAVFSNNKFKYTRAGHYPETTKNYDGTEYHSIQHVSETVEGEGEIRP